MSTHITYPASLPVSAHRADIMRAIQENQVVVIAGETGSGKTTQIPKMLLEAGYGKHGLIGHTQPRRIAARSVAARIAEELGTELGQSVGYHVRFTQALSASTAIKVMTDGVLLAEISRDRLLKKYSAIIIDEAHERSLNIDFLLGYLKQIRAQRPELKIIITSATIDTQRFAEHFANPQTAEPAPIIEVSGRTYPVETRYRPLEGAANLEEDQEPGTETRDPTEAIIDALKELAQEAPGDVLVFLAGEREIRDTTETVRGLLESNKRMPWSEVLPLFGRLSLAEQQNIFRPAKAQRIVLATNVAETSLTVPGIRYVIDPGTARISRYSRRTKVQRLPIEKISQASAKQRSGRSGRTSPGVAIRLYSEQDFLDRREFTEPEILRTSLASVILHMLGSRIVESLENIHDFPFVEPPDAKAINDGVNLLRELGAFSGSSQRSAKPLSAIGKKMSSLEVDPRMARMILEADTRGCLAEIIVLVAALSIQDPRELPSTDRAAERAKAQELHRRFADKRSDFTSFLLLYAWIKEQQKALSSSAFRKLCHREYLNYVRIREWDDLITQLKHSAKELKMKVSSTQHINPAAQEDAVHMSVLSALVSQVGHFDKRTRDYAGARGTHFSIFPGSALFKKNPEWVVAAELVETSRLWARTVAHIDPAWVEQVAPAAMVRRNVSEPHYSTQHGAVMAYEKVSVFSLTLVAGRRVPYAKIDPVLAREIFIRHALVYGEWRTHHRFFKRNRERLAEVERLQERTRRQDLLVDEQALMDFYTARIPDSVSDTRSFDAWYKKAIKDSPGLLDFDPASLLSQSAEDVNLADYPTHWKSGDLEFALSYEFNPGASEHSASEGVSVHIPLVALNTTQPGEFRWQIPGLRLEMITALVKALPKETRKPLVPAPQVATEMVEYLRQQSVPYQDDLAQSLSQAVRQLRNVEIPVQQWDFAGLEPHLKMHFVIEQPKSERSKKVQVRGDDLEELKHSLITQSRSALAEKLSATPRSVQPNATAASQITAQHITGQKAKKAHQQTPSEQLVSFPAEGISPTLSKTDGGHTLTGYQALADTGTAVHLGIYESAETAGRYHRRGIARLLSLVIENPRSYLLSHLSGVEKVALASPDIATAEVDINERLQQIIFAATESLIPEKLPYTAEEFEQIRHSVRSEQIERSFEIISLLSSIISKLSDVREQLARLHNPVVISAREDMNEQLAQLVYPQFLDRTPFAQLKHYPRYLTAMSERMNKLATHSTKDAQNMAIIQRLEDDYDHAVAGLKTVDAAWLTLEQARWGIEELRVSLFAQKLKTAYSISEHRVRKLIQQALSIR